MRSILNAVLAVASLTLAAPATADQNDPRLDQLFSRLKEADDLAVAKSIERDNWGIWTRSGDEAIDREMEKGLNAMDLGNAKAALTVFDSVVKKAPEYAEGWNKRATLYWLMGDFDASAADIDATLALEPRHFGALSGLAMIRISQDRPSDALHALERLLHWHPKSPSAKARAKALEDKLGKGI